MSVCCGLLCGADSSRSTALCHSATTVTIHSALNTLSILLTAHCPFCSQQLLCSQTRQTDGRHAGGLGAGFEDGSFYFVYFLKGSGNGTTVTDGFGKPDNPVSTVMVVDKQNTLGFEHK